MRIQLLITQRCNAVCEHCDKAVGYARIRTEYTGELMREHTSQLKSQGIKVKRLTISGGEPIVNRHLQDILDEAPEARDGRVLTNDLPSTKERRDAIRLPPNYRWVPSPLDNPSDVRSGKNDPQKRDAGRFHHAYWISPADYGYESTFGKCGTKYWCGRGLDAGGWSMCGQAPILAKLLNINPYPTNENNTGIHDHVMTPVPEMCKHCMYGMDREEGEQLRQEAASRGESVSETYREAFKTRKTL